MNAPDKIYLLKVELEERWPGITEASELNPEKEECYIRKDALLEWAEEEMTKAAKQSDAYERRNAFMDVIDKINSM